MDRRFLFPNLTYALRCYDRDRLVHELRYYFRKTPEPEGLLDQLSDVVAFIHEEGDRLKDALPGCEALLDLLSTWADDPRYVAYRQALEAWRADHPHVQLPRAMRRLKPLAR